MAAPVKTIKLTVTAVSSSPFTVSEAAAFTATTLTLLAGMPSKHPLASPRANVLSGKLFTENPAIYNVALVA